MNLVPKPDPAARRSLASRVAKADEAPEAVFGALSRVVRLMRRLERPRRGGFGRGFVYIVAVIAAAVAAIGLRAPVVRAAPALAALYEAIGLPVNLAGLAFRNVRARVVRDGGRKVLVTEGEIVNIRREENDVPSLLLAVRSADGVQRYGWTAPAPKNRLAPGEAITFRARLATPPEEGAEVVVRFAGDEPPTADPMDLGELRLSTDGDRVSGRDIPNPVKMP